MRSAEREALVRTLWFDKSAGLPIWSSERSEIARRVSRHGWRLNNPDRRLNNNYGNDEAYSPFLRSAEREALVRTLWFDKSAGLPIWSFYGFLIIPVEDWSINPERLVSEHFNFQRINVVGSSGCGKSTVSQLMAERLGYRFVEIDALQWKPNWTESTDQELFTALDKALEGQSWVLDGNYSKTVPVKWKRVQLVVWLDLPYWLILYQVILRTFRRSLTGEELWAGNRETLRKAFLDRDSIILWSLTNLRKVRRQYLAAMSDPRFAHITFLRIRSRAELQRFLDTLPS